MIARPPRTIGHARRDAAIQRFDDVGLVAALSCNGSNPEADIQIAKGPRPGEVIDAWITARGLARLEGARLPRYRIGSAGLPHDADVVPLRMISQVDISKQRRS